MAGLVAEVRIGGKDAIGFGLPGIAIAADGDFFLDGRKRLEKKLTVVTESNGVLAWETARDLMNEDFPEREIDCGGGLEIADGIENVRREEIAVGDAADLAAQVKVAKGSMTAIDGRSATLAVGAKASAATAGNWSGWFGERSRLS
jgi:hypothetical protein